MKREEALRKRGSYRGQTGKLGSFRRDLGGATAVKSKGRGEKSYPGAGSRAARGQKRMLQCTCQMNIDI